MNKPVDETAGLSANERIKARSRLLRGSILEGLKDPLTGAIAEEDTQLTKFHGTYQQDDRDLRQERLAQKLEPLYSFMIRVRVPGGVCTPRQWLELDRLATSHANGTLRLTTRQAFQFHGVLKRNLRDTIYQINQSLLDTLAACGDVNRNVMCGVVPERSDLHAQAYGATIAIADRLLPQTGAYHEIWLGRQRFAGGEPEREPLYGETYLPRKFKIAVAVPPRNDVDVYANDLGFIAIEDDSGGLAGFNVCVGGGLGRTHGEEETYPRLADVIGFCRPDRVADVAQQVVTIQRDYGDRQNRKRARFKYTIDDRGLDWFREELQRRLGWKLDEARACHFDQSGDDYGWVQGRDGLWYGTLFIENGRVADRPDYPLMTGLRRVVEALEKRGRGELRLTGNQNLCIAALSDADRQTVEALLSEHGIMADRSGASALRRASMACVALPTCGLAMAEAERYLPHLVTRLDEIMAANGLSDDPIVVRMTGCPNGCGRPYLGEVGLVGKSPGHYQLWLGASPQGDRLNQLYRESVDEEELLAILTPLIRRYAVERHPQERFGDFVVRVGIVDNPMAFEI